MGQAKDLQILLVEDDEHLRSALLTVLEESGFAAVSAENGQVALELCKENNFDLILSDIRMPKMDGLKLLSHLKEEFDSPPVILMTGFLFIIEAEEPLESGAEGVLSKPFRCDDLLKKIEDVLLKKIEKQALKKVA